MFGRFDVDFQHAGRRYWLETYESANEAACAYDIASWRLSKLNFPEVQSRIKPEFVRPKMTIVSQPAKPRTVFDERVNIRETDKVRMARFVREHEYVQYEAEWYWKRG